MAEEVQLTSSPDHGSVMASERRDRLRARIADDATCLVTTTPASFAYVTGCWIETFSWLPTRRVYAVLSGAGFLVIASTTHRRELDQAGITDVAEYSGDSGSPEQLLFDELGSRGLLDGPLALEFDSLPASVESRIRNLAGSTPMIDATELLRDARMVKDSYELAELHSVGLAVATAGRAAAEQARAGDTERDLGRWIADHALRAGAMDGFLVVTSGPRTVLTHGPPTARPLSEGDVVRIDIIRRAHSGYLGDIAQTFFVGEPSDLQRSVVDALDSGLNAAVEALNPGSPFSDSYRACRSAIAEAGFEMSFGHIGHSIGLELHEHPLITEISSTLCQAGMVVCVEAILEVQSNWYHLERLVEITATKARVLAGASNAAITISI
jgi:Xaa-Pro dipeptidase